MNPSDDQDSNPRLPPNEAIPECRASGAPSQSPALSLYQHQPLSKEADEIRLLRLVKHDPDDASLLLEVRHVSLNDNPTFRALSYAWGEDSADYPVSLSGSHGCGVIYVRSNLWDFLREAQKSSAVWTDDWIWIDQICIDQSHHAERCHQVSQMVRLYTTAQCTIVWVGLLELKEDVSREKDQSSFRNPAIFPKLMERKATISDDESEMGLGGQITIYTYEFWVSLASSRYWKRLWTVQEMILPPELFMFVGDQLWHFEDLLRIVHFMVRMSVGVSLSGHVVACLQDIRSNLDLIQTYRGNLCTLRPSWALALALNTSRYCAVQLDRVYAVMGMLHEDHRVYPDYTVSPNQVLRSIIERQLEVLEFPAAYNAYAHLHELITVWSCYAGFGPAAGPMLESPLGRSPATVEEYRAAKQNVHVTMEKLGFLLATEVPAEEQFRKLLRLESNADGFEW